jgi:hypothetical protein
MPNLFAHQRYPPKITKRWGKLKNSTMSCDASLCKRRRRRVSQYWHGTRFSKSGSCRGLGLLSQDRSASRQARCGDAALEATVLAMDQMVQRFASQRRDAVWPIRFQWCPVLPEFYAGSRRTVEKTYCVLTLYGVSGPLRWSDLQIGGVVLAPEGTPDEPVEFIVPRE